MPKYQRCYIMFKAQHFTSHTFLSTIVEDRDERPYCAPDDYVVLLVTSYNDLCKLTFS